MPKSKNGKKTFLENILQQLTISLIVVLVLSNTLPPWEYANESVVLTGSIYPAISVEIIIVVTKPDGSTFQAKVN
ncbi:MAG: hypothetical protein QXR84_09140, partial [Candidatus Bathyarchaeia archaeon]